MIVLVPKAHIAGKAGCFQSKSSWNQKLHYTTSLWCCTQLWSCHLIRFKQTGFTGNQTFTVSPWKAKRMLQQWEEWRYICKRLYKQNSFWQHHRHNCSLQNTVEKNDLGVQLNRPSEITKRKLCLGMNKTKLDQYLQPQKTAIIITSTSVWPPRSFTGAINLIWEKSSNRQASVTRLCPQDPSRRANCFYVACKPHTDLQPTVM